MVVSSGILQSYLIEANELSPDGLLAHNKANKGKDFLVPLNFYLAIVDQFDEAMLPYIPPQKQDELRYNLQMACLLLLTQFQYESTHQKTENQASYAEKIRQYSSLFDKLDPQYQALIANAPEQAHLSDGKPMKYCGIALAEELAKQVINLTGSGKTKSIKQVISPLNDKRLYWVWGSSFLKTVLSMMPEDFFNTQQAGNVIRAPDPYTGCLSWSLYYFRFSLNLFLLLKHTIKHPWMSKEESSVDLSVRFQTQWAQRKFELLNDSIWGTANLISYFWLHGKGALGAAGDLLTIFLLVLDITITLWDLEEQKTKNKAEMEQFEKDIQTIKTKIAELTAKAKKTQEEELKILQLKMQLKTLEQAKDQCARDWQLKKVSLYQNIAYAVSLTLAFVILTTPFMPIPAGAAAALGIVGAVLCFALTVINNAIRSGLEIRNLRQSLKGKREERQQNFAALKELLKEKEVGLDDNRVKLLYLEIMKNEAATEYQREVIILQTVQLVRNIIIESLIPAIIFATLVFLPLGIGLGVLGGVLGLALASNLFVQRVLKPDEKMQKLPDFDQKHYEKTCEDVKSDKSIIKFFDSKPQKQTLLSTDNVLGRKGGQ